MEIPIPSSEKSSQSSKNSTKFDDCHSTSFILIRIFNQVKNWKFFRPILPKLVNKMTQKLTKCDHAHSTSFIPIRIFNQVKNWKISWAISPNWWSKWSKNSTNYDWVHSIPISTTRIFNSFPRYKIFWPIPRNWWWNNFLPIPIFLPIRPEMNQSTWKRVGHGPRPWQPSSPRGNDLNIAGRGNPNWNLRAI